MDLVLKLRELRRLRGLTQRTAARISGVGAKTISSFETGERIAGLTVLQLEKLVRVYGVSLAQFFSPAMDREIAPWEHTDDELETLVATLRALPPHAQALILEKLRLAIEVASELHPPPPMRRLRPSALTADRR